MKLLLDTHIWLWSMLEPARLRPKLAAALRREQNELWLSPISLWETVVLLQKGRVVLSQSLDYLVAEMAGLGRLRIAPVTAEVALEVGRLEFGHGDPADRFLAATARVYGFTLATADQRLLAAPGLDCFRS